MYSKKIEEHAYKTFQRDLSSDKLANTIILYGKERYLIDWAVEEVSKKYIDPNVSAIDMVTIDEDIADNEVAGRILDACRTYSLFSERKVVLVKNKVLLNKSANQTLGSDEEELNSLIELGIPGTILIFVSDVIDMRKVSVKRIVKSGKAYDFKTLDREALKAFIRKQISGAGLKISNHNLQMIIDMTGYLNKDSDYDLYSLRGDLNKLVALTTSGEISGNDILNSIIGDEESYIFDFMDSIIENDKTRAFKIAKNIMSSVEGERKLLGNIISQFELLLSVKDVQYSLRISNFDDIANVIGVHRYRVKKMMPFLNKYSINKVKTILMSAYECDKNIKSGLLKPNLAIELLIANI